MTSIGDSAFIDCSSLVSITIPNSVTCIGQNAFDSCTSLANITIPSSVTSIGDYAFEACISLTSINFLSQNPPTVGFLWLSSAYPWALGHAYNSSSFPAPGNSFNGLTMGAYLPSVLVSEEHSPSHLLGASAPSASPAAQHHQLPAWVIDLPIAGIVIAVLLLTLLFSRRRRRNKIATAHSQ